LSNSFDGQRWFSDAREAQQCEQRREKFFTERAKSLKRSATFATGTSESHPRTMIADPQPGAMRRKDNI
jgi:hypothetical protein